MHRVGDRVDVDVSGARRPVRARTRTGTQTDPRVSAWDESFGRDPSTDQKRNERFICEG